MTNTLYLVDGNSYAYRAFYGLPHLSNRKGQPTQAVYGFALFLLKLLREREAAFVAVAFDPPGPTFRHEAFEAYKAQRKPMPDDLVSQLPLIHDLVRALGVSEIQQEGYEADDVIATLASQALKAGQAVVIYSGDKDILQLVKPSVRVVVPRKEDEEMDAAAVVKRWGVPPERIVDLLSLMGDASDNLPGVPGVGEKTAAALLMKFGSLDALYERVKEAGSAKLQEKLLAAKEQVYKTRELAQLRTDVPVKGGTEATERRPQDHAKLHDLFTELEFTRLLPVLSPKGGEGEGRGGPTPVSLQRADAGLIEALHGTDRVWCVRINGAGEEALALGCGGKRWLLPWSEAAIKPLREFLEEVTPRKVVDDSKALARLALLSGARLRGVALDAQLAAHLTGSRGGQFSSAPAADATLERQAALALATLQAATPELERRVNEDGLGKLLREIEIPVAPVLAGMELRGIRLDRRVLQKVKGEIKERLAELEMDIVKTVGDSFNILSPKQVGEVLFKKLNLPAKRKTKTGYSTDEAVLDELSILHPAPGKILEYRKLAKLLGTYLEPLPEFCAADGLLHTTFNQMGAATGRLSSSDPNMQNIPVRGEIGQRIRSAFVPRAREWLLLSSDYAQIELRILAHITQDEVFLEAFKRNEDVHASTAAEMFGRQSAVATPDQRRAAKAVNFGIIYGMTAYGLSRQLKCDPETAKDYLNRYFQRHPSVKTYWDQTLAFAREHGYVATLFGRRRQLPEIAATNKARREEAEREALNHPVQGTAADLMKLAMVRVTELVPEARLLLSIHDELLFEVPREKAREIAAQVCETMESVGQLAVPLKVEAAWGDSWAACHA